jgi:hypothetical protein
VFDVHDGGLADLSGPRSPVGEDDDRPTLVRAALPPVSRLVACDQVADLAECPPRQRQLEAQGYDVIITLREDAA